MSETFGRTFSGGLTVEDLRDAWLMLEQTFPRTRIPQDLVDRLRRDWRRSDQGVRSVLATLKKMHRGGERGSDKSTLWDLTQAERGYVFTGRREPEPAQPLLPIDPGILLAPCDAGELIAALRVTNGLLQELIEAILHSLEISPSAPSTNHAAPVASFGRAFEEAAYTEAHP